MQETWLARYERPQLQLWPTASPKLFSWLAATPAGPDSPAKPPHADVEAPRKGVDGYVSQAGLLPCQEGAAMPLQRLLQPLQLRLKRFALSRRLAAADPPESADGLGGSMGVAQYDTRFIPHLGRSAPPL